jgi:hypothetical protein
MVRDASGEAQRDLHLHALRTVLSTAIGALTGAVVGFYGAGWLASVVMSGEPGSSRGLAGLGLSLKGDIRRSADGRR